MISNLTSFSICSNWVELVYISQMLNVWYIYLHLAMFMVNVGKYTILSIWVDKSLMGNKLLGSDQPLIFVHPSISVGTMSFFDRGCDEHGFIPGNRALAELPTRKIYVPGDSKWPFDPLKVTIRPLKGSCFHHPKKFNGLTQGGWFW